MAQAIGQSLCYKRIPALAKRGQLRVLNFYSDFNERLTEVPFFAGRGFSVADITAVVTVDFATDVGLPIPKECRALKKWYDRISERPSMSA
jgi:glutathione S-transferase